jgi:hypothetical protein
MGGVDDDTQQQNTIWILTMLYLDRASSVDTVRSILLAPKCPFVTPRSVHRLVVTAFLLAQRAMNNDNDAAARLETKITESLGIPNAQLQHMQEYMSRALGDSGLYVSPLELAQWTNMWERTWNRRKNSRIRRQQQQNVQSSVGGGTL